MLRYALMMTDNNIIDLTIYTVQSNISFKAGKTHVPSSAPSNSPSRPEPTLHPVSTSPSVSPSTSSTTNPTMGPSHGPTIDVSYFSFELCR